MRQLSKIIFINSAGIRYGEVRLDGNVHLIGTQGVGKSTILRAILFFYTTEKAKLGISREKKSFDEFYLPGADSYLIYQVESEFGAFCVLVFRHHAHAAFRFIGGPYQREWFIGEDGSVTADSSQIRRRLGPITLTRIVDQYQEYRDILYGNHTATEKEFSRYALTETPKYQNIPRSLQNVFLGAKVDADFIKDIIIRSLGDEEPGIDLIYFRGQLAEFDREYNDIRQWFRKEKSGEVKVRVQAQKLIDQYRRLLYLDDELESGLLELRFAQRTAQERIPLTEKHAEETELQLQKHKEKLSELEEKYKKELSSFDEELGIVKDALEKIPKLRKQYEALGIQALLEEDGREPALKAQLATQEQLRARLTRQYTDISAKYQDRETTLKLGFENWKAAREQRKVDIGEAFNVQVTNVLATTREETDRIHASFAEREEAVSAQVADLKERMAVCDKQLALTAHLSPYAKELASARNDLARLQSEERALAASEKTAVKAVETAIREGQLLEGNLNREWEEKLKAVRSQLAEKTNQISQIQELLVSLESTLVQWLSKNKPDWTANIGKVTGENILYATKLYPSLAKGDTFYGIDLDLSSIKTSVRTPEQLLTQKQRLEKDEQALETQLEALIADKETALQSHRKKINAQLKALREELSRIQTARLMLPTKIEGGQKQMSLYEEKTLQERAQAENKLKDQLSTLTRERVLAEEQIKAIRTEKEDSLRKVRENEALRRKSLLQQRDEALSAIAKEIAEQAAKLQESLSQLARERQQELSGQGADTQALSQCESAIQQLGQRLGTITQNKETLFRYRSDKENYFDQKDHFLSRKKAIEEKKEGLQERYKLKRRKEEDALNAQNETLLSLKQQLHTLREGLQDAESFQKNNTLPLLPDNREKETDKNCRQLIDEIHRSLYQKQNTESDFHQSISAFTDLFSPGNVFGFKTDCRTGEDYLAFAASLVEFIDNDKIEEFRRRTSEHYTDLRKHSVNPVLLS